MKPSTHLISEHFVQPHFREYDKGPGLASSSSNVSPATANIAKPVGHHPFTHHRDFTLIKFKTMGIKIRDSKTYIYHFSNNADDTVTWQTCSITPNKIPEAIYPHVTARPIYPDFLRNQFLGTSLSMEIFVKRLGEIPAYPVIILRAPTLSALKKLHELVYQWLTRPEDDKLLLLRAAPLPQNQEALLRALRAKFSTFLDTKIPPLFSDSLQLLQNLQNKLDTLPQIDSQTEDPLLGSIRDIKYKCVVATYKYLTIDTDLDALTSFCDFFKMLEASPSDLVSPDTLLTAVWYLFEIFTPHMSSTIANAMNAWAKDSMADLTGRKIYQDRFYNTYQYIVRAGNLLNSDACAEGQQERPFGLGRHDVGLGRFQGSEGNLGRGEERLEVKVDRHFEAGFDRNQDSHFDRGLQRSLDANVDRGFSRDGNFGRDLERNRDEIFGRALERNREGNFDGLGRDRDFGVSLGSGPEKPLERILGASRDENFASTFSRDLERFQETLPRNFDRISEMNFERNMRALDSGSADRFLERPGERYEQGFHSESFPVGLGRNERNSGNFERHPEMNFDRHPVMNMERNFDRVNLDRYPERHLERYPQNLSNENFSMRTNLDRNADINFERSLERNFGVYPERMVERYSQNYANDLMILSERIQRPEVYVQGSAERYPERIFERINQSYPIEDIAMVQRSVDGHREGVFGRLDKPLDSTLERHCQRTLERNQESLFDRSSERKLDLEISLGRNFDRDFERGRRIPDSNHERRFDTQFDRNRDLNSGRASERALVNEKHSERGHGNRESNNLPRNRSARTSLSKTTTPSQRRRKRRHRQNSGRALEASRERAPRRSAEKPRERSGERQCEVNSSRVSERSASRNSRSSERASRDRFLRGRLERSRRNSFGKDQKRHISPPCPEAELQDRMILIDEYYDSEEDDRKSNSSESSKAEEARQEAIGKADASSCSLTPKSHLSTKNGNKKRKMAEDFKGLDVNGPTADDRRNFTAASMAKWIYLAKDIIKEHNLMGNIPNNKRKRFQRALDRNTPVRMADKNSVLQLWSMVKRELRWRKAQKQKSETGQNG